MFGDTTQMRRTALLTARFDFALAALRAGKSLHLQFGDSGPDERRIDRHRRGCVPASQPCLHRADQPRAVRRHAGANVGVRTMTETPLKVVKPEPAPSPTPNDALDIEALVARSALGDGLTDTSLAHDTRRQAEGLFPGSPGSRLPPPYRNLCPQDRRPDRDGVLHSGAEDAGAVGGSPALRSRHLHLSRRLAAAVADHVSA